MALQSGKPTAKKIEGPLFSLQVQFKFNILSSSLRYGALSSLRSNSSSLSVYSFKLSSNSLNSNSIQFQIHSVQVQYKTRVTSSITR